MNQIEKERQEYYIRLKKVPIKKLQERLSIRDYEKTIDILQRGYKPVDFSKMSDDRIDYFYKRQIHKIPMERLRRLLPKKEFEKINKEKGGIGEIGR